MDLGFGNSMMMAKVIMINFRERGIKEDEGLDTSGNGEEEKRRGGRGRERDGIWNAVGF